MESGRDEYGRTLMHEAQRKLNLPICAIMIMGLMMIYVMFV